MTLGAGIVIGGRVWEHNGVGVDLGPPSAPTCRSPLPLTPNLTVATNDIRVLGLVISVEHIHCIFLHKNGLTQHFTVITQTGIFR